ncbi:type II secretion system protein [Candidatus Ichthyocystis hellenicum]|uniref:type II secretion system protein n=1 Tax=Candidatus Ichthyocystis hellenicum TaxID=1561003 RepID=UPI000B87805A|nr:type II secretion system protein [Candidatus Ichthyocystis hellenicum]
MAYPIKNGEMKKGFTFIELIAVMVIISLMVTIAIPRYHYAIERAKISTLKQDLFILRKVIDEYYSDKGFYPKSLESLQEEHYIRSIPVDPTTKAKSWEEIRDDANINSGIIDIRSRAQGKSYEGIAYTDY